MSAPTMTLFVKGETEPDSVGFIVYAFEERPVFHASPPDVWTGKSKCGLARIDTRQPFPVGHLMWFARPCRNCWDARRKR